MTKNGPSAARTVQLKGNKAPKLQTGRGAGLSLSVCLATLTLSCASASLAATTPSTTAPAATAPAATAPAAKTGPKTNAENFAAGAQGIVQYVDIENMMVHVSDLSLQEKGEKHEFGMIMQPMQNTTKAAGELQRLWKTYQDKSRWRLQLGLNASITPLPMLPGLPNDHYAPACAFGLGFLTNDVQRGLYGAPVIKDMKDPAANIDWKKEWNLKDFKLPSGVTPKTHPNDLDLKWWGAPVDLIQFQSFPVREACPTSSRTLVDGTYPINWRAAYRSEVKTLLGVIPMQINQTEVAARINEGCNDVKKYYEEYLKGVLNVMKSLNGGMVWSDTKEILTSGGQKMALYQVATTNLTGTALPELQKLVSQTGDPAAAAYLAGLNPSLAGGQKDKPAGAAKFEDLKRALPVTNPLEQTRIGYANIFQIWADFDVVRDPKAITLHTVGTTCGLFWCSPDAVGIPVPGPNVAIGPGVCQQIGGMTWPPSTNLGQVVHAVPRFHFRWVSVPEGHMIPDVKGDPLGLPTGFKL